MLTSEFEIPGYAATEALEPTHGWTTFRARRITDGQAVVIKAARFGSTTSRHLARLRNESEIAGGLDLPFVVRALGLETTANGLALVLEDHDAAPLEQVSSAPLEPVRFLRLAIRIAEALGGIHARDVVHKDIQPQNILVDAALGRVWLTNFGIATRLPREHRQNVSGASLEGTLAYCSPEQTGRMNRFLDWRSDLYSLGVTFYRLLTGRLPFVSDDPLELIHHHVAHKPTEPIELVPTLPLPLSQIVTKLLAKVADERFQSAHGLRADLDRCLSAYAAGGTIPSFELGLADSFGRSQVSRALRGRERGPVDLDAVVQLVADALGSSTSKAAPFARLLHRKTEGDPLLLNQFLVSLHGEGSGASDEPRTPYVGDLVTHRIREMSLGAQAALRVAGCLDHRFDVGVVAAVNGGSPAEVAEALEPACADGLLVAEDPARGTYVWFHDRIQQAASSLVSEADRPRLHLAMGRAMMRGASAEDVRMHAFEIARHLSRGASLMEDGLERLELARLNLMTGRRATAASAHAAALGFLRAGIDVLPADAWETHHDLALELHRECATSELNLGHNDEADRLFRFALERSHGALERVEIYEGLMISSMNRLRFADAISVGLDALRVLGVELPRDAEGWKKAAAVEMALMRERLAGVDVAGLIDRPIATSSIHRAATRILDRMVPPAHNTSAELLVVIGTELVKVSLEHGHVDASPYGYAIYGMLLPGAGGGYGAALEFGLLGVRLIDKMDLIEARSAVLFVVGYFVSPWKRSLAESIDYFRDGYRSGALGRDPPHVGYNLMGLCQYVYFSGEPLERVDPEVLKLEQYSAEVRIEMAFGSGEVLRQTLRALRGLTRSLTSLSDGTFDEDVFFRTMVEGKFYLTSNFYYLVKLQLCFVAGDLAGGWASAGRFEAVKFVSSPTFMAVEYCLYHSLLLAASHLTDDEGKRGEHLAALRVNVRQLEAWARECPENVRHKHLLAEAELARLENRAGDAARGYEEAILAARLRGDIQSEAIAHELAGSFYLARNRTTVGHAFLADARAAYMRWGAEAKVKQLEERYGGRREGAGARALGVGSAQLDAMAVVKGSQAISTELVLSKLVDSLMRVVIEHAGAETGYLLRIRDGQLWIEAAAGTSPRGLTIPPRVPVRGSTILPQSMVDYVQQTGESVLLADAREENPFSRDPYLVAHKLRSILCLPMKRQGQLVAMVYLENNLMADAFSRDRVAILEVLATQAAISIDNATLYEELEERVELRTRALEETMEQLKNNHAQLVIAERKAATAPFEHEMALAQQIQMSILPRNFGVDGLDVSAGMCTASEVGGDYYDVCVTDDGDCWIGVGDVSGHGLNAGLIMLMMQSGLAALVRCAPLAEPHVVLTLLNKMLYENVRKRLARDDFATLSLLRYYPDGRLVIAGAHEEFLVWRAASASCERIPTTGTWVAAMADVGMFMTSKTHQLNAGDILVLYTDGLTEAMSDTSEQFGIERLSDSLSRSHQLPVDELRDQLFSEVNAWSPVMVDDRTLVVLRYRGRESAAAVA